MDQWALASAKSVAVDVHLLTNGLSGCVGLVLANSKQMLLAHVYSDCSENTWDGYQTLLNKMIGRMDAMEPITLKVDGKGGNYEGCLVYSEEVDQTRFVFTQLKAWLAGDFHL